MKSKRIGDKCYILGQSKYGFDAAQQFCGTMGGILAEPNLIQAEIEALIVGFKLQFAEEIAISNRLLWLCLYLSSSAKTQLTETFDLQPIRNEESRF